MTELEELEAICDRLCSVGGSCYGYPEECAACEVTEKYGFVLEGLETRCQCVICGWFFWSPREDLPPTECPECLKEYEREDQKNREIEADYADWAENLMNQPLKRRRKNRAGQRDISDNGYW